MLRTWIVISNLMDALKAEEGQSLTEYLFIFLLVVMISATAAGTLGHVLYSVFYERIAMMLLGG